MPNPEWGVKRVCPTTGKRFYDLNRTPIISPYTGEEVDVESTRRKVISAAPRGAAQKHDETLVDDLDADDDLLADDATDDTAIDDDLLEDEDDDNVSLDDLADVPGDEE
ncbi:MAG: TIGR02300 family protein [Paracoccaceae bacterium]|nr:TIGR02300 family protein [Paracoccaceae bacterium]MDE3238372.1 TIGR02300 family protein [Paracoccaceae bacterium]